MTGSDPRSATAPTQSSSPVHELRPTDASLAEDTNAVAVLVLDSGTHDQFELAVEPGVNPLDVFEPPLRARRQARRRLVLPTPARGMTRRHRVVTCSHIQRKERP